MEKFLNKNFLCYLLYLFPITLVTGPFLPDLILSFTSIYFIFYLHFNKKIDFLYNDFSKIFIIFYVYLSVSSLFADEIIFSLKNTLFYFRFLLFALLLKYLIQSSIKFRKIFVNIFIITLIIISIDALIEQFREVHWLFDKSSYPENDNNRISGFFDEEYILGGFILSFFPTLVILNLVDNNKRKYSYLISIILIILFSYIIIISGERSSFVKLLIFLFLFISFSNFIKTFKNKIIFLLGIFLLIFVLITSQAKLKERLIFHTTDLLLQKNYENRIDRNQPIFQIFKNEYQLGNLKFVYFSKEHHDHAIISLKMFNDKKLFGHGIKMFRFACSEPKYYINERSCSTHSHGVVLSFLSEIGFVGLLFLILIYYYVIKRFFKKTKNKNIDKVILISIFVMIFPLLPSGYFFNNFYSMILYTLVGFYLGYKKINNYS